MNIVKRPSVNSALLFVLAIGFLTLPACDSGGSNSSSDDGSSNVVEVTDNLDGNLTLRVDGTDQYVWNVQEVDRNEDGAVAHNANERDGVNGTDEVSVPNPSELGGGSSDPSGFDEYEIAVEDRSNDNKDLTVTLLKDGTEIAEATDPLEKDSDFVNILAAEGDWAIKVTSP